MLQLTGTNWDNYEEPFITRTSQRGRDDNSESAALQQHGDVLAGCWLRGKPDTTRTGRAYRGMPAST